MDAKEIEAWANRFFQQQVDLIEKVLPFEPHAEAEINTETDKSTVVITVDLSFAGTLITPSNEEGCQPSNLYDLKIEYHIGLDRLNEFPTVHKSSFQVRAAEAPAIRFEYERDKTSVPAAHIHVHGVGGLLSPGLMKNGNKGSRKGDWQKLHLPVGGHRFRPSLEDFLYFVINECGFRGRAQWEEILLDSRKTWLDKQSSAVVRDAPEIAADALRKLGYTVESPKSPGQLPGRHEGW